ncbi:IS66 family insertion sequence element accessory protein TnpB, partial [Burkholderia sp. Ac-20353]|uniref:IS66 family insertion sequence element accessory protein TnpB n=1 Tax=Burkholderia sp. Ac-20353 TaxID=2703894 RepID=UPI00197B6674|nr:IS66 family insertion sequence element accessory protein TnpB [Burkholderia sp. Ac-20353]
RSGFNSLAAKVQTVLERDPFSGHVFVFRGRRGDLVKMLWWSGDGMCLLMKRTRSLIHASQSGSVELRGVAAATQRRSAGIFHGNSAS